jgi:hypothetical protein
LLTISTISKHGNPIRFELNREDPGTGEKIKDVNGTKFTG